MQKLSRFIIKHPRSIVIIITILTIFFALQFRYLEMETDITKQIPQIPAKKYLDRVEEIFGTRGEYAFIGVVVPENQEIFNPGTLRKIRLISKEIEKLPGVDEVISPTEVDYIKGTEWGIEISPILGDEIPQTDTEMEKFKRKIKDNKMYEGVVSRDNQAAAIMVSVKKGADKSMLARKLEEISKSYEGPEKIYVGGKIIVDSAMGGLMIKDLSYLIPIILGVIVIILYFSFRTGVGVILPLSTVVISTVWAIGIMSLLKIPLSIVTFILPILLMAVGTAYGIHLLTRYYEVSYLKDRNSRIEATLTRVGNAVLIAGLTTIAGFISLAVSQMEGLRTFGLLTGFGIASALCFSLIFIPACLLLLPESGPRYSKKSNPGKMEYLSLILARLGQFVYRKKITVLIVAGIICAFFIAGIPLTSTESNPLLFFPSNNPYRIAEDVLNHYFVGTTPLQVIVKTPNPEEIKEPLILKAMEGLEEHLKNLPQVGGTSSINDFIKSINKALHEDREEFYRIPDTREEVAQYLLLYSFSGDPTDFESYVDNQFQTANMMVFLKSGHSTEIKKVVRAVNSYVEKNFPPGVEVNVTGAGSLFIVINQLLVNTFIRSIILSLVLVFIIAASIFRSIKAGLFSLVPICIAILINFGVMGWFKIPLNIGTVAISAIAVGIGIDYAVHFISRLRTESLENPGVSALIATTRTTGKAIFYNAVAVAAGFLVLLFSSIKWYHFMGELMSLVMLISATGALTVLPGLIILTRSRIFKDI